MANNIDKSTISVEGQTINLATSFGSDDVDLTFSKPMRMKIDGMANQTFGFVNAAGVVNSTQTTCLEDSFSNVTSMLGGSGQCSMTVGNDLIAYVYHFTKFFSSCDCSILYCCSKCNFGWCLGGFRDQKRDEFLSCWHFFITFYAIFGEI